LAYFQHQDGNLLDDVIDQCVLDAQTSQVLHETVFCDALESETAMPTPEDSLLEPTPSGPKVISKCDPEYNQLHPLFGWLSPDIIKTFEHTTKYAHLPAGTLPKKHTSHLIQL
jgi:hypothetical protein